MSASEFTAAQLAAFRLPGLPHSPNKLRAWASREGWPFVERRIKGGLARLYPLAALPPEAREVIEQRRSTDDLFAGIELPNAPDQHLDVARKRLQAIVRIETLIASGTPVLQAIEQSAREHAFGARSLRRWFDLVRVRARAEWFALLVPRWTHAGRRTVACHPEAYAYFRDEYLRGSKPAYSAVYNRTLTVARHNGWQPIPSLASLVRRLEREVPAARRVLLRDGEKALERLYPAQERSRAHLGALGAVTADGHKFDVLVRWPDGSIERPLMVAFQDLFSGKILSWRIDRTENADIARLAFLDMVRAYGIPEEAYLDNGRAWASKQNTGGAATRFRFKRRAEDPQGVFTQLCHVHWCLPYHGQSKPIERAFGDLCEYVAKHPSFEGAYTGPNTVDKPHNYGARAVDLEDFLRVLQAQIIEHNARPERRTEACGGRLSFDDAFARSYAQRPIRKASDAQIRMLLLAAEGVTVRAGTADVRLAGNRYWTEELVELVGDRVIVRFDPNELKEGVYVYRLDGTYVAFARCIQATGFDDRQAARDHLAARRAFVKAQKRAAQLEQRYTAAELGRLHLTAQGAPEPPPSGTVVRPAFGVPSLPPAKVRIGPTPQEVAAQDELEQWVTELAAATRR